jgi:hypothetical protein
MTLLAWVSLLAQWVFLAVVLATVQLLVVLMSSVNLAGLAKIP